MPTPSTSSSPVEEARRSYPVLDFGGRSDIRIAVMEPKQFPVGPTYLHYEVNTKAPKWSQWVQRQCLALLGKLGAVTHKWRNETVKEVLIQRDAAPLLHQLEAAVTDIEHRYHVRLTTVFCGREGFLSLMQAERVLDPATSPFSFNADLRRAGEDARTWQGLRIVMLPWLEGIFVV